MLLYEDHKSVVYAVTFSPDGTTLATGAKDGTLFLRDDSGPSCSLRERGLKPFPVHAIDFLPNGSVIAGGEFGWSAWRPEGDGWAQFGPQGDRPVASLAVINDRTVAMGIGDRLKSNVPGTLEIWDIAADRKSPNYSHEPNGVRAVTACQKNKHVAWVTGHRKLRLWDITTSKPIDFPQKGGCHAVTLSPDGRLMSVAVDWTAKIYDVAKRRELLELKGHKGQVAALAFSPDGKTLMTGSWDQTVRLWDTSTGKERANYQWDIGRVYCATYAPDGLRLAAGGDLGRVVVWDAE